MPALLEIRHSTRGSRFYIGNSSILSEGMGEFLACTGDDCLKYPVMSMIENASVNLSQQHSAPS